jgi:hypothetical protein
MTVVFEATMLALSFPLKLRFLISKPRICVLVRDILEMSASAMK